MKRKDVVFKVSLWLLLLLARVRPIAELDCGLANRTPSAFFPPQVDFLLPSVQTLNITQSRVLLETIHTGMRNIAFSLTILNKVTQLFFFFFIVYMVMQNSVLISI